MKIINYQYQLNRNKLLMNAAHLQQIQIMLLKSISAQSSDQKKATQFKNQFVCQQTYYDHEIHSVQYDCSYSKRFQRILFEPPSTGLSPQDSENTSNHLKKFMKFQEKEQKQRDKFFTMLKQQKAVSAFTIAEKQPSREIDQPKSGSITIKIHFGKSTNEIKIDKVNIKCLRKIIDQFKLQENQVNQAK